MMMNAKTPRRQEKQKTGARFALPWRLGVLAFIALSSATLAGCATQSKAPPIAPKGEVVAQGTGPLSFRAAERGQVSVYDVDTRTVIHASGVGPGSVLM